MTLDPKDVDAAKPDDTAVPTQVPGQGYEAPVLIPLGNVHALLAGGGMTISDGGKNSKRVGP